MFINSAPLINMPVVYSCHICNHVAVTFKSIDTKCFLFFGLLLITLVSYYMWVIGVEYLFYIYNPLRKPIDTIIIIKYIFSPIYINIRVQWTVHNMGCIL